MSVEPSDLDPDSLENLVETDCYEAALGYVRRKAVGPHIARDTIEEKVMALKARKAELFSNVIDDGNAFGGSLDADDIRELFA
jgi:hypothetical protein